jgi:hypothetical protein
MVSAFPSREELQRRGYLPEDLELYELWCQAHAEAQQLATRLPEVFGDPPKPRITRSVADGFDDEWTLSHARGTELRARDKEQHWMDITDEEIEGAQNYFAFSDAEGWRFYLPAFIRHYLKNFPLSSHDAVLRPCESRKGFDHLTKEQIAFIDEFMALCQLWQGPFLR